MIEKNKKSFILKIIQYISIALTLIGSIIVLLSFNKELIFYELKGSISIAGFLKEADLHWFLDLMLWVSVFFPLSNAILHIATIAPRIIRNNIVSWIFSPIVAFFGFIQMTVSVFVGLVTIFGGIGDNSFTQQFAGIILVVLSILVFGFFGMWKKPHETRTSTNRLVINNSRTSVLSFNYIFTIYIVLISLSKTGFTLLLIGLTVNLVGSLVEFITEELLYPKKDKNNNKNKTNLEENTDPYYNEESNFDAEGDDVFEEKDEFYEEKED